MQIDPMVEWQRLTETYGAMYDGELLELAANSGDLTEAAQQVLGDEMKKRGLELRPAVGATRKEGDPMLGRAAAAFGVDPGAFDLTDDAPSGTNESEAPVEYTWKTALCECETTDQAQQLSAALHKAGIESWVEGQNTSSPFGGKDVLYARVNVPADRLEEAREIAAKPIPKEVIEDSKIEIPEFEAPVCPKCGAADPILEGVDPVNSWFCEACENEWAEAAADEKDDQEKPNNDR